MKKYTKVYMKFFGYTIADWIPCEIPGCDRRAVDVCHIWAKSIKEHLRDDINNLMAKCREHHIQFGDKKDQRDYLQQVHNEFMKRNGK